MTDVNLDLRPAGDWRSLGQAVPARARSALFSSGFSTRSVGESTLNGIDLRQLSGDELRTVVGFVAEDAHVFDTTIEENLRVGRPAATVEQAARRARCRPAAGLGGQSARRHADAGG